MVNVKAQLKLYLLHVLVMVEQTIAVFPYFNMKKACTTALEKKNCILTFLAKKFDINPGFVHFFGRFQGLLRTTFLNFKDLIYYFNTGSK